MKIRIGYIIKKYREAHNYDLTNRLRKKINWKNWQMPWEVRGLIW